MTEHTHRKRVYMELFLGHHTSAINLLFSHLGHLSELACLLNGLSVEARPSLREALMEHLATLHAPPPDMPFPVTRVSDMMGGMVNLILN